MFADRYLTRDELFAAAAVFTLLAWGFAFLYNICQLLIPNSFQNPNHIHHFTNLVRFTVFKL